MKNQNFGCNIIVGSGATIYSGSDKYPATIVYVSSNGKKITLQKDLFTRLDKNGCSEVQEYEYKPNPNGELIKASLRKDNCFRVTGTNQLVHVGTRTRYFNYSF